MTVPVRETIRPDFPAVVHTYTDALRVLAAAPDMAASPKHLAQTTDRDPSNIRRDAQKLRDAGVVAIRADGAWTLTEKGVRWVQGQDVAAGVATAADAAPTRWPIDKIRPNPANRPVDPADVEDLADAIIGAGDILQPLLLTPPDANGVRMLLAGERRWRAVQFILNRDIEQHNENVLDGSPVFFNPDLPEPLEAGVPFVEREATQGEAALIAVIENTARKDLSPWEDAKLLKAAADGLGITNASELARRVGRAREGDRGGVRDVQTKLRVAREASPAAIAAYEQNGSWDDLRDSCKDPDKIVTTKAQRLALAEIWHKAGRTPADVAILPAGHSAEGARLAQYGLAILTRSDKGDFARVTQAGADYLKAERLDGGIENVRHILGFPEGYGVAKLRTEWLNTPQDNNPWLTSGTQHVSTKSAPDAVCIHGVREASLALYQDRADRPGQEHRYRACLRVEMHDHVLHVNKPIPGPATPSLAYQMAIEDFLKWEWPDAPRALIEWADRIAGPFVVAGRDHHNASRAQEARYALGWDKRQSNSGKSDPFAPGRGHLKGLADEAERADANDDTVEMFPDIGASRIEPLPEGDEIRLAGPSSAVPADVMRAHLQSLKEARRHPSDAALRLIAEERSRQIEAEGFSTDSDDEQNGDGELAYAAAAYAASAAGDPDAAMFWPGGWNPHMFKPAGETRDLVRAGALIVAELERRARMLANTAGAA